jgi:hypothetical protein
MPLGEALESFTVAVFGLQVFNFTQPEFDGWVSFKPSGCCWVSDLGFNSHFSSFLHNFFVNKRAFQHRFCAVDSRFNRCLVLSGGTDGSGVMTF